MEFYCSKIEELNKIAEELIKQHSHSTVFSFYGSMGSGKTTFGKILSQKTGHEMIDLDDYLVNRFNMSIPDMFQISEDYFRNNETYYYPPNTNINFKSYYIKKMFS